MGRRFLTALEIAEQAAPATPGAGAGALYAKTDGNLYWKSDGGTESQITPPGAGSSDTDVRARVGTPGLGPSSEVILRDPAAASDLAGAWWKSTYDDATGYVQLEFNLNGLDSAATRTRASLRARNGKTGQLSPSSARLQLRGHHPDETASSRITLNAEVEPGGDQFAVQDAEAFDGAIYVYAGLDSRIAAGIPVATIAATATDDSYAALAEAILIAADENTAELRLLSSASAIIIAERASAPPTPASGRAAVYAKTDGRIYAKNDAGTEYDLTTTGGGTMTEIEIDFGTTPKFSEIFDISDAAATTSSKIIAAPSAAAATGKTQDEIEFDTVVVAATCLTNGTIRVVCHALPGPVVGKFKINYQIT